MATKTPGEVVLEHFHAPDATHATWWINTDEMTEALNASAWLAAEKEAAWDQGKQAGESTDHWLETNPYKEA